MIREFLHRLVFEELPSIKHFYIPLNSPTREVWKMEEERIEQEGFNFDISFDMSEIIDPNLVF